MFKEKEFSEMNDEEKEAFIEKRKKISRERYAATKAANDLIREEIKDFKIMIHGGNKAIDNIEKAIVSRGAKEVPYVWIFNPTFEKDWLGCALIMPITEVGKDIICHCTYAIKSPNDAYRPHVGRGLCGARLSGNNPWRFEIKIPKKLYVDNKENVQKAVSNMISAKILLGESHIPQRLLKKLS